ncbi:MAG: glycoside hydrolase [Clostridiales bacterium]|nr:glycoside hydrolase [Clostridiales bacterium]
MGAIRINQMGYRTDSTKQVVYVGEASNFLIFDVEKDQLVLEGDLKTHGVDEASKDIVCTGDFSSLKEPGNYCICIGKEVSPIFTISDKQPQVCTDALLKAFYYQRCGEKLSKEHAGEWHHDVCHLQPSYLFHPEAEDLLKNNPQALEKIDTSGGWHDAGDYGRYTVAAAKAVADLLLAYEHYKEAFTSNLDIPESNLPGADILHEVKVELDFLLKMQRKSDGAAYSKVTTRYFPGMIMPEEDTDPLFIFDVSSPATADFAATMAMAARVYKEFDASYANRLLDASIKAYEWLEKHPEPMLFKNPPNMNSGEYGDVSDIDERYWAAGELYRTTGEEKYHSDFLKYYAQVEDKFTLGWSDVGGYGSIAYLLSEQELDTKIYEALKIDWITYAEILKQRSSKDGYGITLSLDDYIWGSTMVLLNQSMHLIIANRLKESKEYDYVIERNWDYLFGMNPMDISYVSGLGEQAIMAPHHRPSAADGVKEPVPGLVSGGPNAGLQDDAAKEYCQGQPPAKCFIDHVESYATNEITIYWNSPAVYVGAYLCYR